MSHGCYHAGSSTVHCSDDEGRARAEWKAGRFPPCRTRIRVAPPCLTPKGLSLRESLIIDQPYCYGRPGDFWEIRAAQRVPVPQRSRCAAGGTHIGRTARALRKRRLGSVVASRGWHSACSSRRDRDSQPGAHTWTARRAPSASAGRGE
jgi:hypothetical protein